MTLEQIDSDSTLPNGLHDAVIRKIVHDLETSTVALEVELLWEPYEGADRDHRRIANLRFSEVSLFAVQPPDNERIVGIPGSIWFKFWRTEESELPPKLMQQFAPDALAYTLYILEWESSIHIVARDVSLVWPAIEGGA